MKKVFDNKKMLLGILTMVIVLSIIVVSSFFPFILDFSKIGTEQFITDQLIIMAITITATVSMMLIAESSNAQNPNSELCKSKVEFYNSMKRITNHTAFFQWIKKVLQVKDRKDIAEQEMLKLGIDYKIFELSTDQIIALEQPQKYGEVFYKALTKKQIQAVLGLKKAVSKARFVASNYYASFKSVMVDKNLSQIASGENKKKILTVTFQLTLKILMTFIGSAILGALVRDIAQDGGSTAQAWMRFLSRCFAYVTSSFLGYTLGCKINDLDAFYILKRVEVHTLYLEDKNFIYEDEAKIEYMKRIEKEITNG